MFGSNRRQTSALQIARQNMLAAEMRCNDPRDRDAIFDRTAAELKVASLESARKAKQRRGFFGGAA